MSFSQAECIDALQRADDECSGNLSYSKYKEHQQDDDPSKTPMLKHFDSWSDAKQAAGVGTYEQPSYTKEDCLKAVERVSQHLGRSPTMKEYKSLRTDIEPPDHTICRHIGGWTEVLLELERDLNNPIQTKDSAINALQRVADLVGGTLTCAEYREHSTRTEPSQSWIERQFGSWNAGKEAAGLDCYDAGVCKDKGQLSIDVDYFKEIDTPEKAYFLGLVYADGSITERRFTLRLIETDRDIIETFRESMGSEHTISHICLDGQTDQVSLSVARSDWLQHLHDRGLKDKTWSDQIPELDDELFIHWTRGLCDGDGYIGWGDHTPVVTIRGSTGRLQQVNERLELSGTVSTQDGVGGLTMYGDNARNFVSLIYPDGSETSPKLQRKFPDWYSATVQH